MKKYKEYIGCSKIIPRTSAWRKKNRNKETKKNKFYFINNNNYKFNNLVNVKNIEINYKNKVSELDERIDDEALNDTSEFNQTNEFNETLELVETIKYNDNLEFYNNFESLLTGDLSSQSSVIVTSNKELLSAALLTSFYVGNNTQISFSKTADLINALAEESISNTFDQNAKIFLKLYDMNINSNKRYFCSTCYSLSEKLAFNKQRKCEQCSKRLDKVIKYIYIYAKFYILINFK